jgi:kynurenine formamidase
MEVELKLDGYVFRADLSAGRSIARTISVVPAEGTFDTSAIETQSTPYRDGNFVGSMLTGGSCNVDVLKINSHCCGTHTETLLHLVPSDKATAELSIDTVAPTGLQVALMLTLETSSIAEAKRQNDSFTEHADSDDRLVSAAAINAALDTAAQRLPRKHAAWDNAATKSLVLRVAEDDPARTTSPWSVESTAAPYFTADAIELLNRRGVVHLLVEFPSIDRVVDGGQLANHRRFWNIDQEAGNLAEAWASKTITEMIEVSPSIEDDLYLLSIQTPPIRTDAMLSRPVLFSLFD